MFIKININNLDIIAVVSWGRDLVCFVLPKHKMCSDCLVVLYHSCRMKLFMKMTRFTGFVAMTAVDLSRVNPIYYSDYSDTIGGVF